MKMMNMQCGMILILFLVVLIVVVFGLYIGMKLFLMYQEYYLVWLVMKSLVKELGVGNMEFGCVQDLFFKCLYINYFENVKLVNVIFDCIDGGWNMKVNYEVCWVMIGNFDVVGWFDINQELICSGVE